MPERRRGWGLVAVVVTMVLGLTAPAPAAAHSNDSEAPPDAAPHWLPPEAWVYNHWLPYDEGRLYRLVHITRRELWHQLRDDHHTLAQLAARHGWHDPHRLAVALVAPRATQAGAARLRVLRSRALRTLTQGHLAQHLFFHSLHQFAIPSAAPDIFGISDMEFRALRRSELSPLDIGRLHGRSPARVQAQCASVLRERIRAGVGGGAMTARQGRILLGRQLSQLPRWLGQERYNGPPQTHEGMLVAKPHDYASNPAIAADGLHVAFEAYQQKLPLALQRGEISVVARDLPSGAELLASPPNTECSTPSSSYNPSISGDGRYVAFECSEGNLNFAKRYGQISVFVRDTVAERTQAVGLVRNADRAVSRSFYNPAISADGRRLAFEAVRRDRHTAVLVCDLQTGATTPASRDPTGDVYEPSISGDGRKVAFTTAPRSGARVYLRDLVAQTTAAVSTAQDGFALDPAISADGRVIAYTSVVGGTSRVLVHDMTTGVTQVASRATGAAGAPADGDSRDPSISADGTRVAFASAATNLSASKPDDSRGVFVRDLVAQTTTLVSSPAGAP